MPWSVATGTSRTPRTTSRTGAATSRKSGFLPAERQWLTELLTAGWVDVVRVLHPDGRIDYQIAMHGLAARARAAWVERAAAYALRWSDHAPVTIEYATGVTP